jgi:hypothetical protein
LIIFFFRIIIVAEVALIVLIDYPTITVITVQIFNESVDDGGVAKTIGVDQDLLRTLAKGQKIATSTRAPSGFAQRTDDRLVWVLQRVKLFRYEAKFRPIGRIHAVLVTEEGFAIPIEVPTSVLGAPKVVG